MAKKGMGCFATVANIIWCVTGGWITALMWLLLGCLFCITIIGIPVGKQCFKFMNVTFFPFGKDVNLRYGSHAIGNTFWLIFIGLWMGAIYIFTALINFVTIIGIPSGIAAFRVGKLALAPFGATITQK